MIGDVKKFYKIFSTWCNGNQGVLTVLLFLIPIIGKIFFSKVIFLSVLILSLILIIYLFRKSVKRNWKILVCLLLIVSGGSLSAFMKISHDPEIMLLTKGFKLTFEDTFVGGNISEDTNFPWKDKDKQFAPIDDDLSLKSSAALHQTYPLFQDFRNTHTDYILVTKFFLPDGARVSTQFMNMRSMDSPYYLGYHFQECVISTYDGTYKNTNYTKGYGDYLYEKGPKSGTSWNAIDIKAGIYFMLVKVSSNKFSCYIQNENEGKYITIFKDKDLIYQNIGGPAISKRIDGKIYMPKILDFKLYHKITN